MANQHLLEALDRTLCDLMDSDPPFSGKVIVLGGDFRQMLSVVKHGSRVLIVAHAHIDFPSGTTSASSIYVKTCVRVKTRNHQKLHAMVGGCST